MTGGKMHSPIRIGVLSCLFLASARVLLAAPPASAGVVDFALDRTLKIPVQPVRGLAFGGDPPTLAALGDDGAVRVWKAVSGDLVTTIALADHPKTVSCLDFSPDGKWIVVGEASVKALIYTARIALLDVAGRREVRTLATHHWEVVRLAFSRDGRYLASANWDRKVRVFEFPSGNPVREFESPAKPHCVAISPDAKFVASGGLDSSISLWDRASGKELPRLNARWGGIQGVAFSPDGRHLASVGGDGSALIWNVTTGQCVGTLTGHVGAVTSVIFSPDGGLVVTGGADNTLRFWDPATGRNVETFGSHSGVWQVAFSSDGMYLAAGYADGTISVWKKQD